MVIGSRGGACERTEQNMEHVLSLYGTRSLAEKSIPTDSRSYMAKRVQFSHLSLCLSLSLFLLFLSYTHKYIYSNK